MGIADRKDRQRAERETQIVTAARQIAESEGWNAVTIRRLADEIEFSQPVLYSHFENRDAIVAAVALQGFKEIAAIMLKAAGKATRGPKVLTNVALAYLDFSIQQRALYDAMFVLPTSLLFAEEETKPELRTAFGTLAAIVAPFNADVETATETFWATLHGLATLERSARLRPGVRNDRIALVVKGFVAAGK